MTSSVVPLSPRDSSASPLACAKCMRRLGSRVAYCPFCGTVAATDPNTARMRPLPATVQVAPPPPEPPAAPPPAQSTQAPPLTPVPADNLAAPGPLPTAEATGTTVSPTKPRRKGRALRRLTWTAAAVVVLFGAYKNLAPRPTALLSVHVTSSTGATIKIGQIFIDDHQAGAPDEILTVPAGTLTVRYEQPGWSSETTRIIVASGATSRATIVARPLPAHLAVATNPPGALVTIASRAYGRTPLNLELPSQSYTMSLALDGYLRKTIDVPLSPGESRNLSFDLAPIAVPVPQPTFQPAPFDRGVVVTPTPLLAGPSRTAATLVTIDTDTEVAVLGQVVVAEETWLQVRLGSRPGFLPATGALEPWDAWANRHTGSGSLDEVTPGLRAIVGGVPFTLSGVKLTQGGSEAGLIQIRNSLALRLHGQFVTCVPQTTTAFQCKTPQGNDIGEYYVLNGAAVPGDGAPSYYYESQQRARLGHKGVWTE